MHTNDEQKRFNQTRAYLLKETTKGLIIGTTIITAHLHGPVIHNQIKTGKLTSPRSLHVSPVAKSSKLRKFTEDFFLVPKETKSIAKLKCIEKISLASKKNSRWQITNGISKSDSKPTQIKNVNQLQACKYLIQLAEKYIRPRNSSMDWCEDSYSDNTIRMPKLSIGCDVCAIEKSNEVMPFNSGVEERRDESEHESAHSSYCSSAIKLFKCEEKSSKCSRRHTVSFKDN